MSADNRARAAAFALIHSEPVARARREARASLTRHLRGDGIGYAYLFDRQAELQQLLEMRELNERRYLEAQAEGEQLNEH
jgi:hypothetical protein